MKSKNHIISKIILTIFVLVIIIPILTLLIWTFTERWASPDLWPQVFSTRALDEILGRKIELLRVFMSSIMISLVVATLSIIVGTMTARAIVFYEFKGKNLAWFFSILPFMVPATVFAIGIPPTFIKLGLNNTIPGVIISHLICSLPYAVRLLMDGTIAVGNGLEEPARVLGTSAWKAFVKVTLPVLAPVMLSSFSMAYIVSFSQYFLTLLIGGGRIKTFTIVMVPYLQGGNRNIACVYSTIFFGITLLIFAFFEWIAGRLSKNNSQEYCS
ncbi:MAG: ABC transporter permease subunit [Lachnoclostridium sp.]